MGACLLQLSYLRFYTHISDTRKHSTYTHSDVTQQDLGSGSKRVGVVKKNL